jgi:membrane-associated protein
VGITMQFPAILGGLLDPQSLIDHFGSYALWGAMLLIFIECWLFPFLPGDSLLFTVGLLIARGESVSEPIWLACILLSAAAVLSNVVGYAVGAWIGPPLFDRPDSRLFKREYVDRTHAFFERYGNRAIVLARFVPIVRTFITLAAGIGDMTMRRFVAYSAIGGVIWASGVTVMGYYLGRVSFVHNNIELMLVAIVAVSMIPVAIEWLRARRARGNSSESGPPRELREE